MSLGEVGVVVGSVVGFVAFEFLFAMGVGRFLRGASRDPWRRSW